MSVCMYVCVHVYVYMQVYIVSIRMCLDTSVGTYKNVLKTPDTIEVLRLDLSICCRDYRVSYDCIRLFLPIAGTSYTDHRKRIRYSR